MKQTFLTLLIAFMSVARSFAGGIIFYTSGGASYINVAQYETYSAPSAHLSYITVKGGQKFQIQSSGIIANIPLPTTGTEYSLEDIQTNIAQANAMASRQPKYAQAMQKVSQLWNDQIPVAEAREKQRQIAEAAARKKKEEANMQLAEEAKRKVEADRIAAENAEKQRVAKEEEVRNKAEADRVAAEKNERDRIAKEAEANRVRQEDQRKQVDKPSAAASNPFAETKATAQQQIDSETAAQNAKKKAEEAAAKEEIDKEERRAMTVNEAINNPPNFSIKPRGPTVHGFRLGMPYTDFVDRLKTFTSQELKISPGGTVDVTDLASQHNLDRKTKVFSRYLLFNDGRDRIATVAIAGKPPVVIDFFIYYPILKIMFKTRDLPFKDFCQKFIDAYKIPSLEGSSENSNGFSYEGMGYKSTEGWSIYFNSRDKNIDVNLVARPDDQDRGFGR